MLLVHSNVSSNVLQTYNIVMSGTKLESIKYEEQNSKANHIAADKNPALFIELKGLL